MGALVAGKAACRSAQIDHSLEGSGSRVRREGPTWLPRVLGSLCSGGARQVLLSSCRELDVQCLR